MLKPHLPKLRTGADMTSIKIVQLSGPPSPLVHLRLKFFHPLDLGGPISNKPSPPFPNDNQSIKKKT